MAEMLENAHKRQRPNDDSPSTLRLTRDESKSALPITSLDDDSDLSSSTHMNPLTSSSSTYAHHSSSLSPGAHSPPQNSRREGVPEGLVRLNVGGRIFQTDARTLKMFPRSYFGVWFSGKFRIISEPDGSYFLDRNPDYFGYILDFMRDNSLVLPDDAAKLKRILTEAEFFQLGSLVAQLKAKLQQLETTKEYENFRCSQCQNVIGNFKLACAVNGQRLHTCQNPGGHKFHVVTVPTLHGKVEGEKHTDGTWFQGYVWQYAKCIVCDDHLGWYFTVSPRIKKAEKRKREQEKAEVKKAEQDEAADLEAVLMNCGASPSSSPMTNSSADATAADESPSGGAAVAAAGSAANVSSLSSSSAVGNAASLLARFMRSPRSNAADSSDSEESEPDLDSNDPRLHRDPFNPRAFWGVMLSSVTF